METSGALTGRGGMARTLHQSNSSSTPHTEKGDTDKFAGGA